MSFKENRGDQFGVTVEERRRQKDNKRVGINWGRTSR